MSMESPAAPSLVQLSLGELEGELAATRRMLERVPDDRLDWKPHAKSMSLGDLAHHVARLPYWFTHTLAVPVFDITAPMPRPPAPASTPALLELFDATTGEMRQALAAADDALLTRTWQMRAGDRVLQSLPTIAVLRTVGLNHLIHHRGQLSVYLRMLDVPLPPLYGPTADERPDFG